jgi:hypothetical protein
MGFLILTDAFLKNCFSQPIFKGFLSLWALVCQSVNILSGADPRGTHPAQAPSYLLEIFEIYCAILEFEKVKIAVTFNV